MIRFKLIAYGIISALCLNGCSEILEPISLYGDKQNVAVGAGQEEFEIDIKNLTFETAKKANNDPYTRRLILTGSGSKANVSDEVNFLKSNFPEPSSSPNYLIGIGDMLSFTQLNEYETKIAQWPIISKESEYLLGAGDKLTFTQSNDNNQGIPSNGTITAKLGSEALILTEGIIGSNGNILLFGLGNIQAANRSLDNLRTEVRNILIRNGLAPNFQLEISEFKSQKAYVTNSIDNSQIIFLNNLPISLKEVALTSGLSESDKSFALITLTRGTEEFRFTAGQLFDLSAPMIIIKDNDQIEIQIIENKSTDIETVVGSKGNILLKDIGSIPAVNRTIDDVREDIINILIGKGIKPNFQLEISKFASKKVYIIQKNIGSKVISLDNSNNTLRELLLNSDTPSLPKSGLSIIKLKRNGQVFRMTRNQILNPKTPNIWVVDKDHIELENLPYKPGQVFALGGAGNAEMILIDPSKRETLADILFTTRSALKNLMAKRSEVYLLRGLNPSIAYHLDAQNVSRILVAAKTELRPNDIVYVAERPIISFSRTLSEIIPLRTLIRDIQNNNIP